MFYKVGEASTAAPSLGRAAAEEPPAADETQKAFRFGSAAPRRDFKGGVCEERGE